jgi:Rad3-related DNA helicase
LYRSKEQSAFARLIAGATKPGAPLLAGAAPGLGKTHGYAIELLRSGKRVAIAVPTRQLASQFLASDALATAQAFAPAQVAELQPRTNFERTADYRAHRESVLAAQVLVVTHAAAMIDSLAPGYADLRSRDVILFDEADLLADAGDLRTAFTITVDTLAECGVTERDAKAVAERVRANATDPEDSAAARAVLWALDHPAWYRAAGFDDEGALLLRHRMPGRMLLPLLREAPRSIFVSGTLQVDGRFDYFVRSMGLREIDPASRHIEPAHHGHLTIELAGVDTPDAEIARRIAEAQRPTLVITTSHADAAKFGAMLPDATQRGQDEALSDAMARCPDDGILIAAGAWSGVDEPRLRWRTIVMPRVPYGVPVTIDGQEISHYVDSRSTAIRRICQGLHRGLRTADAVCKLLLLDPRFARPDLRSAIPLRFQGSMHGFEEGRREEVTLSKLERDPSVRRMAIDHHGCRCQWPACGVDKKHQLDVHHLDPVSEGVRKTTVDDVRVLCKNHHAEAHFFMRSGVSTLDAMAQVVTKA